jgi:hypothetical protein
MKRRKVGERWLEEADGEIHLFEAVRSKNICRNCYFGGTDGYLDHYCFRKGSDGKYACPFVDDYLVVRDLGVPVEGKLTCPVCGKTIWSEK